MDSFYHAFLASNALVALKCSGADVLDVARWICCEHCPSVVPVEVMVEATQSG